MCNHCQLYISHLINGTKMKHFACRFSKKNLRAIPNDPWQEGRTPPLSASPLEGAQVTPAPRSATWPTRASRIGKTRSWQPQVLKVHNTNVTEGPRVLRHVRKRKSTAASVKPLSNCMKPHRWHRCAVITTVLQVWFPAGKPGSRLTVTAPCSPSVCATYNDECACYM
jgi:hypothetical protein